MNKCVGRVHGYKRIHFKMTEATKGLGWCHFLVVLLLFVFVMKKPCGWVNWKFDQIRSGPILVKARKPSHGGSKLFG